ncbi:MAG: DUF3826 domain-containing protein [Bacteroidetes bacterium]|nr:MAG: DUF3826 domain-containing protein [Bacteroidota bacterium]
MKYGSGQIHLILTEKFALNMKGDLLAKKNMLSKKNLPAPSIQLFPSFFNFYTILRVLLVTGLVFFFVQVFAQTGDAKQQESAYRKVVTERSAKIVNTLGITDSGIVGQYTRLNDIDEQSKAILAEIKSQSLTKENADEALKKAAEKKSSQLMQLHEEFIAHLHKHLSADQVEKVKDGMTYNICPITYAAYLDMLPSLTTEQKEKIYGWLKEARELAMDEGSSEKKHAVFGKYKGRINNYLSAAGYDMKKEGEEWQKRIKEREAKTKEQKSS